MPKNAGERLAPREKSYRAKVFKNGGSQAIRLPKECRVEGTEVRIRRQGKSLVVEPIERETQPGPKPSTHPSWSKEFVEEFFRGPPRRFIDRPAQGRLERRRPLK